ncbi:dehydrogenase [Actinocatenispora thailandica]|uniref:Dehydrogenase n=1 Tax=Actinocatenispora thailandica TaxID=227318 RepID=A0A7R7HWN8_9ACTN|nr:alcohol dehydrogenase catalytic domain-containing protein [Actinocatenispora thailandica]BCJ34174.1 dehydrogenase [Actinocatenispora thailandica]
MSTVWLDAPGTLRVAGSDRPEPGAGEAVVRVGYAGICGSDREALAGTRPAPYQRYPVVPGHEWSGTVAAVGTDVDPDLVGRKVVGEGFRNCQVCAACRRGDANLCAAPYAETGFTEPGAWSDWLRLPARLLHTLPDAADLRAAAGLEPAACVAAACLEAAVTTGDRVAVVGGGMLGLLALQLLRAASPAELVLVHPNTRRAALATACGADELVTVAAAGTLAGRFDAVLETAGAPGAAQQAVTLTRRGGRTVLAGLPSGTDVPLVPAELVTAKATVHTVFGAPPRAWTHAVRAFAAGILDPGPLITHELALDEVAEAFRLLDERRDDTVKVLLHP